MAVAPVQPATTPQTVLCPSKYLSTFFFYPLCFFFFFFVFRFLFSIPFTLFCFVLSLFAFLAFFVRQCSSLHFLSASPVQTACYFKRRWITFECSSFLDCLINAMYVLSLSITYDAYYCFSKQKSFL